MIVTSPGPPSFAKQRVGDGSYVVGEHDKTPTSSTTDSVYRRLKDQVLAANQASGKFSTAKYSGDPIEAATPKGFVVRQFVYGLDYIDGERSEREWAATGKVNRTFTSGPRPARRE